MSRLSVSDLHANRIFYSIFFAGLKRDNNIKRGLKSLLSSFSNMTMTMTEKKIRMTEREMKTKNLLQSDVETKM